MARKVIRNQGTIVLSAMTVLVASGFVNILYVGVSTILAIKLVLVAIAILLAVYQYGRIGARIWRDSADGPTPDVAAMISRFRRVGMLTASVVLAIVFLSLGLTRG